MIVSDGFIALADTVTAFVHMALDIFAYSLVPRRTIRSHKQKKKHNKSLVSRSQLTVSSRTIATPIVELPRRASSQVCQRQNAQPTVDSTNIMATLGPHVPLPTCNTYDWQLTNEAYGRTSPRVDFRVFEVIN